jgi:hypothetical protein
MLIDFENAIVSQTFICTHNTFVACKTVAPGSSRMHCGFAAGAKSHDRNPCMLGLETKKRCDVLIGSQRIAVDIWLCDDYIVAQHGESALGLPV